MQSNAISGESMADTSPPPLSGFFGKNGGGVSAMSTPDHKK